MSPEDRTYRDSDDRPCDLPTLCRREPQWACSRIIKLTEERDAYRKAKAENDERFIRERDDAREKLRALVEANDVLDRTCQAWERAEAHGGDTQLADVDAAKARFDAALKAARGAL